jgi:hypothetical protein
MTSRCVALFLLVVAIAVPLTLESAPAPRIPIQAVIDLVEPPKGMSMETYRDQQIIQIREKSVHHLVDCARSNVTLHWSSDGVEKVIHYAKVFALSIVKERKEIEALLTRKFQTGTRDIYIRLPAEKEQKEFEAWLNKNLQIEKPGTRFIRIRFAVGSKSEQAVLINALIGVYLDLGLPHARRVQIPSTMSFVRDELSRYRKTLAFEEGALARMKREVPMNKEASVDLSWRRASSERMIARSKLSIESNERYLRILQADFDDLSPAPVIRRWAKD